MDTLYIPNILDPLIIPDILDFPDMQDIIYIYDILNPISCGVSDSVAMWASLQGHRKIGTMVLHPLWSSFFPRVLSVLPCTLT